LSKFARASKASRGEFTARRVGSRRRHASLGQFSGGPQMSEAKMPEVDPKTLPPTKGTIVPYMQLSDASAASQFYQKAFGATEVTRLAHHDGKRLIHCHLYVNDGSIMLNDAFTEM